ncbi:MAG: acyl-[acyl-carrier-protein] thioesterase [Firmicutes bacterium]|nr:acyl-[acyl-carrier-protein] thioesterase [Bacillota bacterium]
MYQFTSRVRFSETDHDKKLSLISLIDYFQDCCTFQSEDLGAGIDILAEKRLTWMLASWQIVIKRYPELCEKITIGTWPYAFKSFFGNRNVVLLDENNETAAYANCIWILVDLDTGKPVRPQRNIIEKYEISPKLKMDYAPRKIKITGEPNITYPAIRVYKHQIDANNGIGEGHMNNGQYVLVASELLPKDSAVRQVRVDYRKAAVLDDIMVPKLYINKNIYTVGLESDDGEIFAIVEFDIENK